MTKKTNSLKDFVISFSKESNAGPFKYEGDEAIKILHLTFGLINKFWPTVRAGINRGDVRIVLYKHFLIFNWEVGYINFFLGDVERVSIDSVQVDIDLKNDSHIQLNKKSQHRLVLSKEYTFEDTDGQWVVSYSPKK